MSTRPTFATSAASASTVMHGGYAPKTQAFPAGKADEMVKIFASTDTMLNQMMGLKAQQQAGPSVATPGLR